MIRLNELDRVISRSHDEKMAKYGWIIEADLGEDATNKIEKILEVVKTIIRYNPDSWPDDAAWDNIMPVWIQEKIPKLTPEECQKILNDTPRELWNKLPWEFYSWIDAIRDRAWEWWSYKLDGNIAKFYLISLEIPERINAFEQIIIASGGRIISRIESTP
ncbi:hypothetical protein [Cardiobacterium hominis]|uniref:Uncharacterized protein n=1 Tax=Cardiobacterium hominis (strain ATCC 15826 / DSM 8339 / NCTC 10426 / 6573) TaxID=638300 RepID=C8NB16_CARH6|nr:hypothetical protein [Cardiobacterium hominis]EEV88182.1 hypothetical protein HMPREF0198_1694 [Cardiobacterium hominis ATCC 15826]